MNYFKSSYRARVSQALKQTIIVCICVVVLAGVCLQPARANVLSSERAMTAAQWGNTIAVTSLGNRLYSIEKSGALYQTDLATGKWVQVGKAEFGRTSFLFADNQSLYTIETDGSLYRSVRPAEHGLAWARRGSGKTRVHW